MSETAWKAQDRKISFYTWIFHFTCEIQFSYTKISWDFMRRYFTCENTHSHVFTSEMTRNFRKGTHENSLRHNVTFPFIKLKSCLLVMCLLTCITKKSRALYVCIGLNILLWQTPDDFTRHGKISTQERQVDQETGRLNAWRHALTGCHSP